MLKTVIVDDDVVNISDLNSYLSNNKDIEIVGTFSSSAEVLEYAKEHTIDCAFLDINMPEINGFELTDKLRSIRNGILIVFMTAYESYAVDAIRKKVDSILFKPYDTADVDDVIFRLKGLKRRLKNRIYCKTFGRFDVFVDEKSMIFKSAKAKELFALCIYRSGALVSAEDIIENLWEDYTGTVGECSAFRMTTKALTDTLKGYGLDGVFKRERGACYIMKDMIDCDYYDFLDGDEDATSDYQGEFMIDYPWSELAIYSLNEKKMKRK